MSRKEEFLREIGTKVSLPRRSLVRVVGGVDLSGVLRRDGRVIGSPVYCGLQILGVLETSSLRMETTWQTFLSRTYEAVVRFRRECPVVYSWLVNGGFDPTNPPDHLVGGSVLHASRVSGRLRAGILRELRVTEM
ncbi:MAG: hypothetical protein KDD64_04395 [Bdellovibrionales bacterium]|nr:hypothetical protein [Bdellovibrionales bacterium]